MESKWLNTAFKIIRTIKYFARICHRATLTNLLNQRNAYALLYTHKNKYFKQLLSRLIFLTVSPQTDLGKDNKQLDINELQYYITHHPHRCFDHVEKNIQA